LAAGSGCVSLSRNDTSGTTETGRSAASGGASFQFPADHCEFEAGQPDSHPLAVQGDSRSRFGCAGKLLDGMEDLSRWGVYDGRFAPDTTRYFNGTQSARLETTAEENRVWVYRRFDPGLDLTAYDVSVAIHPGHGDTKARMLRVQLLAPDRLDRVDMRHGVGRMGGWFRLDLGPTVVKGTPDLSDVREIRIQSLKGSRRRLQFNVDELRLVPKADRARVMLTFDDIPISQYENAFPLMEDYGYPGVAGAIPWLTSDPDFMSKPQLQELQNAGWDVVSHPQLTDPSTPLPELSREDQTRTLERSKQWLVDNGFESGARFVIWPFHAAGATTLDLASRYHSLGFAGGRAPCGIPPTDPLTVGRVDGNVVKDTLRMISFAEKYNQLAVVMYHQIGPDGLPVDEFERTLEYIDRADVEVITASDLRELMN
jgi:peptidoglycan/xylan/chitin deacetylase (PgdA/CDA1 family)